MEPRPRLSDVKTKSLFAPTFLELALICMYVLTKSIVNSVVKLTQKDSFLRSFSWSCQELSPVNIFQLDVPFGVEGMLLKVHVLKIGVHI